MIESAGAYGPYCLDDPSPHGAEYHRSVATRCSCEGWVACPVQTCSEEIIQTYPGGSI